MEYTAVQLDEIRHRQRVEEAVRRAEYKTGEFDKLPKKERITNAKRVKTTSENHGLERAGQAGKV